MYFTIRTTVQFAGYSNGFVVSLNVLPTRINISVDDVQKATNNFCEIHDSTHHHSTQEGLY